MLQPIVKKLLLSILICWFVFFGIVPIFSPTYQITNTSHEKDSMIQIDLSDGRSTVLRIFDPIDSDVTVIQGDTRWTLEELPDIGVGVLLLEKPSHREVNLSFSGDRSKLSGAIQIDGDFAQPIEKSSLLENSLWAKLKRFLSANN